MRTDLGLLAALEHGCQDSVGDVLLVHSQPENGFALEAATDEARLQLHWQAIRYLAGERDIWFWAHSRAFVEQGRFDVRRDTCDDLLGEYACAHADWRTAAPVASIAGIGGRPKLDGRAMENPLGTGSPLHELAHRQGLILTYGCGLESTALMEYCESQIPAAPYRYPQQYTGELVDQQGNVRITSLELFVTPPGKQVNYDWPRLEADMVSADAALALRSGRRNFLLLSVPDAVNFLTKQLQADPLYLLTAETRSWIEPLLARLGRGFRPDDFESTEVSPAH